MMNILKAILYAIGMFALAVFTSYFLWQAVFILLLTTPLKGMSLTAVVIVYIGLWLGSLILLVLLYRARGAKGIVYFSGSVVVFFLFAFFLSKGMLTNRRKIFEKGLANLGCYVRMDGLARVPADENAAFQYDNILESIKDGSVPLCFYKLSRKLGNTDFTSAEVETLSGWLVENKDILASLDDMEMYPRFRYREYQEYKNNLFTIPVMNFLKIRKLAKLLCARIIVGKTKRVPWAKGDPLAQLVHIASSLNQEYILIYQVVARLIATDILSLCTYELLHYGKSSVPVGVLADLSGFDFLTPGLQGEISGIVRFGSKHIGPSALRLITGVIMEAWMCENMYLVKESLAILRDRENYGSVRAEAVALYCSKLPELPYNIFPVLEMSTLLKKEFEYRTTANLVMILRALVDYQKKYGEYPDRLEDLKEAGILLVVPRDVFGGNAFVYSKEPAAIQLYSIGPDGNDDGGLVDDKLDIGYNLKLH